MLIVASVGALAGLAAWRANAAAWEGENVGAGSDNGGYVDDLLNIADDLSFQALGVRVSMSNWENDLNGRGAPYKARLNAAEVKHGIPHNLLARLAWQESRFREDVVQGRTRSSAGAVGIMQIVPRWHPEVNPLNVSESIDYAAGFLASLYRKYKSWELALKAYNWGPGNVDGWLAGKKTQPLETILYSQQILFDVGVA